MAVYHVTAKIISRSTGRSAVAAAAYRSGEELTNERDGVVHDYSRKNGVIHAEIMTPENALDWVEDRNKLWNEVEKVEKSNKAQLAREVEIAVPNELKREQQIELVQEYAKENFVKKGMVADIALHDKGDGNPHAHIMLTMRPFEKDGSWGDKQKKEYLLDQNGNKQYDAKKKTYKCKTVKTTDWDKPETLEKWRENWAKTANKHLERAGHEQRIDHRSYKEQGVEKLPTIHLGPVAHAMEKRGERTNLGDINREIKAKNSQARTISREIESIKQKAAKDITYFEKFISTEKEFEHRAAAPEAPQQEKPAQKSPERPRQPQKEEVRPEVPQQPKELPEEKWQQNELSGTPKEWSSFCSQKYREFRNIAFEAEREVAAIQKKIDKLHEPYVKEAAEQHLREKYQPQLNRIEKDFQEHLRENAEHNKKATLWNRIVNSDQVTANAERLERQEESLRREHAAVKESWVADKSKVEKGIIPDGSGSSIRTIAINLAQQRDLQYGVKKATLEKSKQGSEIKQREANGIAAKYSKLATKFQMLSRSVKVASKPIKLPGKEKAPAAGGGAGAGAQEAAPQNQSLLAKAASHLAGEKTDGITPLTAKLAEDMSIDWDALTPDELKMKLAQIELQRESRGLSL